MRDMKDPCRERYYWCVADSPRIFAKGSRILSPITTAILSFALATWPVAAQLDPEIQADLHLVQAQEYIDEKNYAAAQEAMGKIFALQKKHDLTIPDEFHFKYAQVLDSAGLYEEAVSAVTHYLKVAGRGAAHYREALILLNTASQRWEEAEAAARAEREAVRPGRLFFDCPDCPEMVVVEAGTYLMGSPPSERGSWDDERPQHRVTVSKPFAVSRYEVTFEEWDACVSGGGCDGYAPDDEGWGRGRRPVINVSWEDAQRFVAWLRMVTGEPYRLLSEAEWEYVARAGTTTPFHMGSTISTSQANYNGNYTYGSGREGVYREHTVEVGSFPSNAFGLYNVHGNVFEWVEDCSNDSYVGAPSNGSAWTRGDCSYRSVRGGSWYGVPNLGRSASRGWLESGTRSMMLGFRVARTLAP